MSSYLNNYRKKTSYGFQKVKAFQYRGVNFNSQLEARWAAYFDLLDIDWEYTPHCQEGFTGWFPKFKVGMRFVRNVTNEWLYLDFYCEIEPIDISSKFPSGIAKKIMCAHPFNHEFVDLSELCSEFLPGQAVITECSYDRTIILGNSPIFPWTENCYRTKFKTVSQIETLCEPQPPVENPGYFSGWYSIGLQRDARLWCTLLLGVSSQEETQKLWEQALDITHRA
jgi:hypothetical protein